MATAHAGHNAKRDCENGKTDCRSPPTFINLALRYGTPYGRLPALTSASAELVHAMRCQ
jgi:hypothetical protein